MAKAANGNHTPDTWSAIHTRKYRLGEGARHMNVVLAYECGCPASQALLATVGKLLIPVLGECQSHLCSANVTALHTVGFWCFARIHHWQREFNNQLLVILRDAAFYNILCEFSHAYHSKKTP